MTDILEINLGTAEQNGKDGDTSRVALGKANTNFAALNEGKLEKDAPIVSGLLVADALATSALTVTGATNFKRSDGNLAVAVDPVTGNVNTTYDATIGGALTVQKTLNVPNYGASFGGALTVLAGGATITGALTQYGNVNFRTNSTNNSLLRFFSSVGSRANVGLNGAEAGTDDGTGSNILFSQVVGATVTNTLLLNRANSQAQFYKRPVWANSADPTTGPAFITPWDNNNLKTPLDASSPSTARDVLAIGGRVLLDSISFDSTAAASKVFQLPAGYDSFEIEWMDLQPSTVAQLGFQISTDGGSSFYAASGGYVAVFTQGATGGAGGAGVSGTVGELAPSLSTPASQSAAGKLKLYRPRAVATSRYKRFSVDSDFFFGSDNALYARHYSGYMTVVTAYNAIKIALANGNLISGTIKLYGVK